MHIDIRVSSYAYAGANGAWPLCAINSQSKYCLSHCMPWYVASKTPSQTEYILESKRCENIPFWYTIYIHNFLLGRRREDAAWKGWRYINCDWYAFQHFISKKRKQSKHISMITRKRVASVSVNCLSNYLQMKYYSQMRQTRYPSLGLICE